MSDLTFDVSKLNAGLGKEIRVDRMDSGLEHDTAADDNSKNMKIMETQENSQGIFGAALERQDGLWDWVNDLDTDPSKSR